MFRPFCQISLYQQGAGPFVVDQLQPVEWWVVTGRGHLRRCIRPLEDETRRRAMAPTRDHNRPVPLSHVGKALGRLKSSIQSLQRKISRLPRGEVLVVVKCVKKNRQGQEAEEWALHGSEALQRAIRPYLSQIQQEYTDILEEEGTSQS
jgi:hypothetical protein